MGNLPSLVGAAGIEPAHHEDDGFRDHCVCQFRHAPAARAFALLYIKRHLFGGNLQLQSSFL